jgi:2-dehydro-3-deoxygalactonokinase
MTNYFLSCDWGSSAFRLRLIDMRSQNIIGEISSDDGVISVYNSWKSSSENSDITRKQFFLDRLKKQVNKLATKLSLDLDGITILVSGMASSSIGMLELPYAILPFPLDGSGAVTGFFDACENFPNPVLLISGAKSEEDVMRGEETQIVGLAGLLNLQQHKAIVILPGTHSKHLYIRNGKLTDVKTFMTGELFGVLTKHSILKDSIDIASRDKLSDDNKNAFIFGIKKSKETNILNSLFSVRTNQLLNKLNKPQNSYYLSGLLIGTEIGHLQKNTEMLLILCGDGNLQQLYQLALQETGLIKQTTIVAADMIGKATIAGQINIYKANN